MEQMPFYELFSFSIYAMKIYVYFLMSFEIYMCVLPIFVPYF